MYKPSAPTQPSQEDACHLGTHKKHKTNPIAPITPQKKKKKSVGLTQKKKKKLESPNVVKHPAHYLEKIYNLFGLRGSRVELAQN